MSVAGKTSRDSPGSIASTHDVSIHRVGSLNRSGGADHSCHAERIYVSNIQKGGPMNPQEYASEIDAMRDLRQRGFTTDLEFRDGALRETATGRRFRTDEVAIVMDAFGAYADPNLAAFLEKVKVREHV